MIIEPIYLNNYEVINPLYDQFGDTSVVFYKTAYLISEQYYKPAISQTYDESTNITTYNYPQMPRLKSGDNTLLFPVNFNYSKYRLLSEEIERQENGNKTLIVWQTWGYTPTNIFSQPATVSWQKPGTYDASMSSEWRYLNDTVVSDEATRTHTLPIDNSDGFFAPGNLVRVNKTAGRDLNNTVWYAQMGEYVNIQSVTSTSIVIPFFKATVINPDGTYGVTVDSYGNESMFDIPWGSKRVQQAANVRSPLAGDYPCEIRTTFITVNTSDELINLQPAWQPELGGQPTDTLSDVTDPTLSEYNSKIGGSEKLLATAESLTQLMGNVYMKQGYYVKYQ